MASANDLRSLEKDPRLFLYTSLTAGSSHIITATSRLETILKANRIPFQAVDIATDEQARKLWQRRAGKKKLPGLVKEGFIIGDYDEVEEWNEYGELKDNIGPLPTTGAAVGVAPKILPVKPTATAGSANVTAKPAVDTSRMVALPGAAEIAARNKIVHKSTIDDAAKTEQTVKTEEPIKAEKMTAAPNEKEKSIEKAVKSAGDDEKADKSEEAENNGKAVAEKEDTEAVKELTAEEKTTGSAAIKAEDVADLAKPSVAAEENAESKTEPIVAESAGATTIAETEKTPEPVASKEVPIPANEQESDKTAPLTPTTNLSPQRRSTLTKSPPDTAIGENIVPVNVAAAADLKDSQKEKAPAASSTSKSLSEVDGKADVAETEDVDPETIEPAAEEGAEAQPTVGTTVTTSKDASESSTPAVDEKKSAVTASPIASTDVGIPENKKSEAAKEGAAIFNEVRDDALSKSSNTAASPAVTAFKDTSSTTALAKTDVTKEHNGAQVKFAPETEIKKVEEKTSIPEEKEETASKSAKGEEGTTIASTVQAAVASTTKIVKDVVEEVKKVAVDGKSTESAKDSEVAASKSVVHKEEDKETPTTASSKTQEQPAAEPKLAEKSVED